MHFNVCSSLLFRFWWTLGIHACMVHIILFYLCSDCCLTLLVQFFPTPLHLAPPLPPVHPSSLSYTQTTEASQTDNLQDHPTSAASNDQQHQLSSDSPNPYLMHSVVHDCVHSTEQEAEVRKDEAVARQSKGKDTRGKIPQKSSSVPHVDLPPNKGTRQMPPSKCVCLC